MFVTREERQPLGGFFTFILPMMVFGMLAVLPVQIAIVGIEPFGGLLSTVLPRWAGAVLSVFALSLLYLWRPATALESIISALAVSALILLQYYLLNQDQAFTGRMILVSWACLLALAGAALDASTFRSLPPFHLIFTRLVTLPIIVGVVILLTGMFSLMLAAIFQASNSVNPALAEQGSLFLSNTGELTGLLILTVLGVFLGMAVAVVRYQRSLVGAVRYAILVSSRYTLPVTLVFAIAAFFALLDQQAYAPAEGAAFSFAVAMLLLLNLFLVYADGRLSKAPFWLRCVSGVTILTSGVLLWPQFSGLAKQISAQGLVSDLSGVIFFSLAGALLGLSALLGYVSDFLPGSRRWMPLLSELLRAMILVLGLLPILIGLI